MVLTKQLAPLQLLMPRVSHELALCLVMLQTGPQVSKLPMQLTHVTG